MGRKCDKKQYGAGRYGCSGAESNVELIYTSAPEKSITSKNIELPPPPVGKAPVVERRGDRPREGGKMVPASRSFNLFTSCQ